MRLLFLLLLFICISCNKDNLANCDGQIIDNGGLSQSQGAVSISCEVEPHFLNLDSLFECDVPLGIDSIFSTNWIARCTMTENAVDSVNAHIKLTYLNNQLEIDLLDASLIGEETEMIIAGDTVQAGVYPYYGAYRIERNGEAIEILMLNRYIGGCFHDELIWRRTF